MFPSSWAVFLYPVRFTGGYRAPAYPGRGEAVKRCCGVSKSLILWSFAASVLMARTRLRLAMEGMDKIANLWDGCSNQRSID